MEVTGRLLIVDGMTKLPEAFGLEPVIVMAVPLLENNNAALEVAVNVSSSARAHAVGAGTKVNANGSKVN